MSRQLSRYVLICDEQFLVGRDSLQKDPSFLSIEQALADYATLIYHVKRKYGAEDSAVIGFGGSYGGMLAAWLRKKYPNALQVGARFQEVSAATESMHV
jgi:pimeloyl-ACP methyl ester carboxylesterase